MNSGSAMSVPTAEEVREAVFGLLGHVDCDTITRKELTSQLESSQGWDLSSMRNVVKTSLNDYFVQASQCSNDSNCDVEDDESVHQELSSKKKGGGFLKPCQLAPSLSKFLSCDILPRTEVIKKLWEYIRENDLQNPKDRREIICDAKLQDLLKRKKVTMFKMNKILAPMMKAVSDLQDSNASDINDKPSSSKKRKSSPSKSGSGKKKSKQEMNSKTPKPKAKKSKDNGGESRERASNPNAFGGPVTLAPQLSKFLGEKELPRTEVTKLMWNYIKGNNLQNPENRREIVCDKKLKELFNVDSFSMFQLASHLKPMLIKIEKS